MNNFDFDSLSESLIEEKKTEKKTVTDLMIEDSNRDLTIIRSLEKKSKEFEVITLEDATNAASMALQSKIILNSVEEKRKELVRPHLDYQKSMMDFVKIIEKTVESIHANIKEKLKNWDADKSEKFETLKTIEGTLKKETKWSFDLLELDKVPREFLMLDEKKVKEAIKNGLREINGLNILEKEEYILRTKKIGQADE